MQTRTLRSATVVLVTALLVSGGTPAFGQEPRDRQAIVVDELVLRDGSRLYGTVEATTDTEVVFRTHAGAQVIVPLAEVASIRKQKGIVERGEFWRADPNRTRLFFAPTGEALARGQVSLGVYNILLPFIQVGLTDRLSIGGGTPLFFGVGGIDRPFWLTPKFQVHRGDQATASLGTLHFVGPDGESGGIAYGVGTFHRKEGSLTFGVGRTYSGLDGGGGVVMFGGESQVSRSIKLLTENYVWTSGGGIVSGGVRFFGERLSSDLVMVVPINVWADFWAFASVNFVYVF